MSDKKKPRSYLAEAATAVPFIALVKWLWPDAIPFEVFSFWNSKGDFSTWMFTAWPVFAWAFGVTAVILLAKLNPRSRNVPDISGGAAFVSGLLVSVWCGFVEEVCFRWLLFLNAIVAVEITNYLIFGFAGFGIAEWLHLHVVGPFADFTTLHHLHVYLFDKGWAVGAAMLSTNAFFRDGHKHHGLFGVINSWFLGMYFFWILFTFGLWPAILVHFAYDAIVFTLEAASIAIRRDWAGA